jgi:hypothetical protein
LEAIMRGLILASAIAAILVSALAAEAKSRTVWEGGFFGGKWVEDGFGFGLQERSSSDRTRTVYHREHRFFRSSRACEAWLYQMRSEWQDMPRYSWCRRTRIEG